MHVRLERHLQARIFEHLEATYPDEGGGFLLGLEDGETITIREIVPITNAFASEEQFHRYAMTPHDWTRLEDDADARGLTLVGYYHSHPDSPAIPSVFDRDHAFPHFTYLITQVQNAAAVEMRSWRLAEDHSGFSPDTLTLHDSASDTST